MILKTLLVVSSFVVRDSVMGVKESSQHFETFRVLIIEKQPSKSSKMSTMEYKTRDYLTNHIMT